MEATNQHSGVFSPSAIATHAREIRYLVPVDFSKGSYHALHYTLTLAKVSSGSIELLHITDANDVEESENPVVVQRSLSQLEGKALERMQSLREIITEAGVKVVSAQSVIGHVRTQLLKKIQGDKPDIIVIGKSRDSIYSESVLSCLINNSGCSVLVIPDTASQKPPEHAVLTSDMKPVSGNSLNPFFEIIQRTSGRLSVLNVRSSPSSSHNEGRNPWGERINSQFDIKVNFVQQYNERVKAGIMDYIKAHHTDLLCAVKRPSGWLKKFFGQSLSLKLAQTLDVPVLVIAERKK